MNIYIKDADTKRCYARIRNVNEDFQSILHSLLCQTGCIESCVSDFWKSSACTIYVDRKLVDMDDYIHDVVLDARALFKRLRGVK